MDTENKTSHHLFISSRDAIGFNSTTTNFSIDNPKIVNATSYRILSVSVPHTYYNINTHNNVLRIFKTGDNQDREIVIPVGNYTNSELGIELKTQLDATAGEAHTYTVTSSDITYKYTIAQDSSSFIIRASSTLNEVIGYSQLLDTSAAISHTAVNIYDLSYTSNIRILSSSLTSFGSKVATSDNQGGVLAEISIYNSQFGETIYHKFNHLHYNYQPEYQNTYDFTLVDDKNRPLGGINGLNGLFMNMHLIFHTRKSNNYTHNARRNQLEFQNTGYGNIYN